MQAIREFRILIAHTLTCLKIESTVRIFCELDYKSMDVCLLPIGRIAT